MRRLIGAGVAVMGIAALVLVLALGTSGGAPARARETAMKPGQVNLQTLMKRELAQAVQRSRHAPVITLPPSGTAHVCPVDSDGCAAAPCAAYVTSAVNASGGRVCQLSARQRRGSSELISRPATDPVPQDIPVLTPAPATLGGLSVASKSP